MTQPSDSAEAAHGDEDSARRTPQRTPRTARTVVAIAAVVTLAAVGGGTVGYTMAGGEGTDTAEGCGAQPATGVVTSESIDPDTREQGLVTVDSGIAPYSATDSADPKEFVSFGFVLENRTEFVLHDAYLAIRMYGPDEDGDGEPDDPMAGFGRTVRDANSHELDNVHVPVVLPGQRVGMGGSSVLTWTPRTVDPATGESFTPDRVRYDKLRLDVELVAGQWWKPANDMHRFTELTVKDVHIDQVRPSTTVEYLDGAAVATANGISYDVESPHCRDLPAYEPSLVAYDGDGDIVGGTPSGHVSYQQSYSDGGTRMIRHAVTPRGIVSPGDNTLEVRDPDTQFVEASGMVVPDVDGLTVEVFPYAAAVTPHLTDG